MPYATYSTPVNASVEQIWNVLLDKAQNPEKYIPYAVDFLKIHERFPNGLLREIKTKDMHMTERVTYNKETGEVKFTVENHPVYTGAILNTVAAPKEPGGQPILTFTMDLQPRSATAEQQPEAQWFINAAKPEMIQHAVLHVKDLIEGKDKK